MAQDELDTDLIEITPLAKGMTSGVFPKSDKDFEAKIINWFESQAVLAQREKKSKTYVATYEGQVIAFINISMHAVEEIFGSKGKTAYEFPVLLVGKLLTHPDFRGHGVGKHLMDFAVDIARNVDSMIGCVGLVVDANKNERTVKFYENYGFVTLETDNKARTVRMFFQLLDEPVIDSNEAA